MMDADIVVVGSFADVRVADVGSSVAFYRALLGFDVVVDHGWYAELGVAGRTMVAFVEAGHETIPDAADRRPGGVIVSFEVDDAAEAYAVAVGSGCDVLVELVTDLGQCHFMIRDPDGAVIDIIQRVPLSVADRRQLVRHRRAHTMRSATCR